MPRRPFCARSSRARAAPGAAEAQRDSNAPTTSPYSSAASRRHLSAQSLRVHSKAIDGRGRISCSVDVRPFTIGRGLGLGGYAHLPTAGTESAGPTSTSAFCASSSDSSKPSQSRRRSALVEPALMGCRSGPLSTACQYLPVVERTTAVRMVARRCSRVRTHGRGTQGLWRRLPLKRHRAAAASFNERTVTNQCSVSVTDFFDSAE